MTELDKTIAEVVKYGADADYTEQKITEYVTKLWQLKTRDIVLAAHNDNGHSQQSVEISEEGANYVDNWTKRAIIKDAIEWEMTQIMDRDDIEPWETIKTLIKRAT